MARHRCDLVMKGGITSGVVFPRAIEKLSKDYDFRNIAGTSAGAIAAVVTAAAQYGRTAGHGENFEQLGELSTWLGGTSKTTQRSNLLQLFQPTDGSAPVFKLAMLLIGKSGQAAKGLGALRVVLFSSPRAFLGLVPGLLLAGVIALLGRGAAADAVLPALVVALGSAIAAGLFFVLAGLLGRGTGVRVGLGTLVLLTGWSLGPQALADGDTVTWVLPEVLALTLLLAGYVLSAVTCFVGRLPRHVPSDLFGMCLGMPTSHGGGDPALTPWLHEQVQLLAGRGPTSENPAPVTFGDLRGVEPPINLRTMTTCVTHGRPYLIPFEQRDMFFDPAEFARLFPADVVEHLVIHGKKIVANPRRSVRSKAMFRSMHPRLPLPAAHDLPILLAARMSLSFPFLLSAVPLWSLDWTDKRNSKASSAWQSWGKDQTDETKAKVANPANALEGAPKERHRPEALWFSDGGLSSNFPVHLFDQMIPKWPTFAINLRYHARTIDEAERVTMVKSYSEGKNPSWFRMADAGDETPGSLGGFAGKLIGAMQNWVDNTLLTVPGYTDRIAHVNLGTGEGGLNLEMTPAQIETLAGGGAAAAEALRGRFHKDHLDGTRMTWDAHRWTRFRSTLAVLQTQLQKLQEAYVDTGAPWDATWDDLIERAKTESPYPWHEVAQADLARGTINDIRDLLSKIAAGGGFDDERVPKPRPELQLRPPL